VKTLSLSVTLALAAMALAPVARAEMPMGNYEFQIQGRYDFHTWVWAITPCASGGCVHVNATPRPVAKATAYDGDAQLTNGRYTLIVDDPYGLRCGDIYYGPAIPTHDTYSWDAATLAGSLDSSFATGCNGEPGGSYTYPFGLSRM
jgi:hypothetical protein